MNEIGTWDDDLSGHAKEIWKDQKKTELEDRILSDNYQRVFSTPEGKAVLQDILRKSLFFGHAMTGNSWTYYYEGMRALGGYILQMTNANQIDAAVEYMINMERKEKTNA